MSGAPRVDPRLVWRWIRGPELLLLTGGPLLGWRLAGGELLGSRPVIFLAALLAGGAHVMLANTLLGARTSRDDRGGADFPLAPSELPERELRLASWLAIAVSLALLALLHVEAGIAGSVIALLWFLYADPRIRWKGRAGADTFVHVVTGELQFLLGPLAANGRFTAREALWGGFVTLSFVAGHFHHVAKDRELDRRADLRTIGVELGPRRTFLLGSLAFALAWLALAFLAAEEIPRNLALLLLLPFLFQLGSALRLAPRLAAGEVPALRSYRRVYRAAFVLVGILLAVASFRR